MITKSLLAIGGGLIIGAAGLGITPAHAEVHLHGERGDRSALAYAMELEEDGWEMTRYQAQSNATINCGQRALGWSELQLIQSVERQGRSFDVAFDIIYGAEFHFCPEYLP